MKQRSLRPSKRGNQKRVMGLQLPRELELNLRAYCEAMDDAPKATVLRKALDRYIQSQLEANEGIRTSYEAIRSVLKENESNLVPLHPVGAVKRQENSA